VGGRKYEKLPIEEFGRQLISTGDLDPVYIALRNLRKADWDERQVYRFLIGYWCWYHCGVASYLSELWDPPLFWMAMADAAKNIQAPYSHERWPRGSERRHARGAQAEGMVQNLRTLHLDLPEGMVNDLIMPCKQVGVTKLPFKLVAERVQQYRLFGPWMTFKVADMIDRVLEVPVDFDHAAVFMFKDPVKAAHMVWRKHHGFPVGAIPRNEEEMLNGVVAYLEAAFSDLLAPPAFDRKIGLQEVETVLCKWKSHQNGHYPLFNDIDEITEGCEDWGQAAEEFRAVMPEGSGA
jgi:hypothetical protein